MVIRLFAASGFSKQHFVSCFALRTFWLQIKAVRAECFFMAKRVQGQYNAEQYSRFLLARTDGRAPKPARLLWKFKLGFRRSNAKK